MQTDISHRNQVFEVAKEDDKLFNIAELMAEERLMSLSTRDSSENFLQSTGEERYNDVFCID